MEANQLKHNQQVEDSLEEEQQASQQHLVDSLAQNQQQEDFLEELRQLLPHQEVYLDKSQQLQEVYLEHLKPKHQEEAYLEQDQASRQQAYLVNQQLLEVQVYLELKLNLLEVFLAKPKLNNFNKFQQSSTSIS